jgi:hypothetical protein
MIKNGYRLKFTPKLNIKIKYLNRMPLSIHNKHRKRFYEENCQLRTEKMRG